MATRPRATAIVKHSLVIAGHSTSVSLEAAFWEALNDEAAARASSIAALVAEIDAGRGSANLSSAIRVHLFQMRQDSLGSSARIEGVSRPGDDAGPTRPRRDALRPPRSPPCR